ncbi:hypothetical protein SAMN04489740_1139 [Arthrobacter alpinus]|uniref:Uncharacterized protein n=2 Tax=Arthrobacter alpinus TaxID=656366 RepID=A0A1H5HXX9_9MICC|nr:hypothetical protein SAMN04489740_1139 [Arthrobacter alpinus]
MNAAKIGHQRAPKFDVERTSRNLSGTTNYLTVAAELEGLRAKKSIYDFDGWSGLLSFFEGLAVSWRGWDGEKNFHSLEGVFRLSAKHDGHVRLRLELEDFDRPDTWTIKAEVTLDPGEDLTAASAELRDLVATQEP